MGQHDLGGRQTMALEAVDQVAAVAEGAAVDQGDPAIAAQQDDAAPAQAAMADGFAGIALCSNW
jgi:hypothetical protein